MCNVGPPTRCSFLWPGATPASASCMRGTTVITGAAMVPSVTRSKLGSLREWRPWSWRYSLTHAVLLSSLLPVAALCAAVTILARRARGAR